MSSERGGAGGSASLVSEPDRRATKTAEGGRTLAQTVVALRRVIWVVDAVAAAAAMLLAYALSPAVIGPWLGRASIPAAVYGAAFALVAYAAGLYEGNVRTRPLTLLLRILVAAALAAAVTLGFFYLFFYEPIGRWAIGNAVALSGPLVLLPRYLVWRLLRSRPPRLLFLGEGALARKLVAALEAEDGPLYEVIPRGDFPVHSAEHLVEFCRARGVDEIVLPAEGKELDALLLSALHCLPLGCRIRSEADFHEDLFSAVPVQHVNPDWMLSRGLDTSNHVAEAVKRLTDVVLALLILVAAAPLGLLAMLAIALSRDGPVFFSQARAGRHGRPFRMFKFRTMRVGAEEGSAQWARADDPRRTRVGRVLRRTHVDELPQVANILLGEMSFVGPRPERPEFVEELEKQIPYYAWRHFVRPGLTGWAQINLPYGSSIEDARRKLEYDLYYIRHNSLLTDLSIVLRTATAALRGAR